MTRRYEGSRKLQHLFWVSSAKWSHILCEAGKMEPAGKHMQELKQKMRRIISESVPALSVSLSRFISLCLAKSVDACFILFLSSRRLLRGVVANKHLYKQTKRVVCIFVTFSHHEVTTRIRRTLKMLCYIHRSVRIVVVQMSK